MSKHSRSHVRTARIRHRRRMLWIARNIYNITGPWLMQWLNLATDRKPCSCWACGNPRRVEGIGPIQERRLDLHDKDDMESLKH